MGLSSSFPHIRDGCSESLEERQFLHNKRSGSPAATDWEIAMLIGTIASVKEGFKERYAWIALSSVRMKDGSPHGLETESDIYLHQEDCGVSLQSGVEVEFIAYPDKKRAKAFRAGSARETERSRLARLTKGGIEIGIGGPGGNRVLEHSSVFANWCLSAEVAGEVKRHRLGGETVKLLIVHWPVDKLSQETEKRQLVDLADPMCAINFDSAGANRIVALIVAESSDGHLHDKYLSFRGGRYSTTIISSDGYGTILKEGVEYLASGVVEAEVPGGLFAKKPSDWKWVNMFFKHTPRDQCAFRRRRIFAYTLQPVIFAVYFILRGLQVAFCWLASLFITAGLLSVGTRGINYAPLRNPLKHSPEDIWEDIGRPVLVPVIKGHRVPLPIAFSPFVLIAVALITLLLSAAEFGTLAWWISFGKVMVALIVLFSCIIGLVIRMKSVNWEELHKEQRDEGRRRLAAEVDKMVCTTTGPQKPNVWQLPLRPKTVRFYVIALKQRVCKGFATA